MTRKLIICCLQSIIDIYEMSKNEKPWANVPIDSEDVEAIRLSIEKWGEQNAEPCDDCISRKATLEPYKVLENTDTLCVALIRANIKQQPSVAPAPKMGHWIDDTSLGYHVSICSNCDWRGHGDTCLIYKPKYCPNCGAKMKGWCE